jgi:hypothetical protein
MVVEGCFQQPRGQVWERVKDSRRCFFTEETREWREETIGTVSKEDEAVNAINMVTHVKLMSTMRSMPLTED